jgi:ribose-phosphate pyrophosphokinase
MHIYTNKFDLITYSKLIFSGGEVQVKLTSHPLGFDYIWIEAFLFNSNDVLELLLLTDAIRRQYVHEKPPIKVLIPYLPYARQDRVCAKGEALSLSVMANLINSQDYAVVEVWDAHSTVTLAKIKNVINVHQSSFLHFVPKKNVVLVSPDAGAVKKTSEASKAYGLPMVTASKIRDVNTGEITGTEVHSGHIGDKDFLIVDDICDGGKTFVELAKVLRPLTNGNVLLYVTHGIFSKGLQVFDGLIDHIYCANRFPSPLPSSPNLTVINTKVYQ